MAILNSIFTRKCNPPPIPPTMQWFLGPDKDCPAQSKSAQKGWLHFSMCNRSLQTLMSLTTHHAEMFYMSGNNNCESFLKLNILIWSDLIKIKVWQNSIKNYYFSSGTIWLEEVIHVQLPEIMTTIPIMKLQLCMKALH